MKACSSNDYLYLETRSSVISGIKPKIQFMIKRETRFVASFRKILSAKNSKRPFPVLRRMHPDTDYQVFQVSKAYLILQT